MGIAGSIIPGLPGPPISWVGILLLFLWGPEDVPTKTLVIWGVVMVAVSIIDYLVPIYFTKATGGSRFAERGAMVGLILGIIFTPIGMILGSFLGAFLSEMYWGKKSAGEGCYRLLPRLHHRHRPQDHRLSPDPLAHLHLLLLSLADNRLIISVI